MKNNYILVDYENVQPEDFSILDGHTVNILLFVGANQTRVPISMASSLQAMGNKAEYVQISGSGRNALDFHMAYEMGRIVEQDPEAFIHIISNDKGFDPLIVHLKNKGWSAHRSSAISEIPFLRMQSTASDGERLRVIIASLAGRGQARPRKVKTLLNTINAHFQKSLTESELQKLLEKLKSEGCVVVEGEAVSYRPPIAAS